MSSTALRTAFLSVGALGCAPLDEDSVSGTEEAYAAKEAVDCDALWVGDAVPSPCWTTDRRDAVIIPEGPSSHAPGTDDEMGGDTGKDPWMALPPGIDPLQGTEWLLSTEPGCPRTPSGAPSIAGFTSYPDGTDLSLSIYAMVELPNPVPPQIDLRFWVAIRSGGTTRRVVNNHVYTWVGLDQVYAPGTAVSLCQSWQWTATNTFDTPSVDQLYTLVIPTFDPTQRLGPEVVDDWEVLP